MSPYPKAILLDLDNTVLAFDQAVEQSWAKVCARYAAQLGVEPQILVTALLQPPRFHWRNLDLRNDTLYDFLRLHVPLVLGAGRPHPLPPPLKWEGGRRN